MTMQKLFCFQFQGHKGTVYAGDFVVWGGMSFSLTSASQALKDAINNARK